MRFAVPLLIFLLMSGLLYVGLGLDPRLVPSPLIGKPLPAFALNSLHAPEHAIDQSLFRGKARLLNIWASWCSGCRVEHPLLVDLANRETVEIIGLNYKDAGEAARGWLAQHGDPYATSIFDPDGRLGLDLGVYGVPETFIVDADGVIRYKHVGPLTAEVINQTLLPMLAELDGAVP